MTLGTAPPHDDLPATRPSRTRRALIEAGKRLISNGRMEGATVDDILREADVAKGSFYNHFVDRDDLSQQVLLQVKRDLQALIDATTHGVADAPAYFARGMLTSFRYGLTNQVGGRVLTHLTVGIADPGMPANQPIVDRLRAGMADGSLKIDSVDAGLVVVMGLSDLGLSRLLEMRDERARARDLMRAVCLALLRGLGTDARRLACIVDEALRAVIDSPLPAPPPA